MGGGQNRSDKRDLVAHLPLRAIETGYRPQFLVWGLWQLIPVVPRTEGGGWWLIPWEQEVCGSRMMGLKDVHVLLPGKGEIRLQMEL